jgi:hypothetical protein
MADDAAVFTDVLSLSVDLPAFAADLSKLENMWSASLGKMSEEAKSSGIQPGQIISPDALASLEKSLAGLTDKVDAVSGQIKEDFTLMGNAVVKELGQIDAAVSKTEEKLNSLNKAQSGGGSFSPTRRGGRRAAMFNADPDASLAANFMSGLTMGGQGASGIAAMAGAMASMATIGAGLYAIFNAIGDIVTAIPHALMNGVRYMETFQQDSSDLQGVLASNVKFSSDFATNFKMAGEAAQFAVSQLRDNAVKANLDPKQLQNSFKALVDSGGGAMTKDTSELVDLTVQFALSMKAVGKSVEGTRALISEIPKLMEGTEAPSSKLLQTLNLTKTQWEQIRQHALEHKDLLAELAPILAPYIAQVKTAQANHEELTKSLDRQKQVIESAFAAPVLKEFDTILKGTLDYINDNKNSIELLANAAGQLVAEVLKLGPALTTVGGEGHPVLAFLAEGFAQTILIVETFRGTLATTAETARQLWQVFKTPLGGNVKAAITSASADIQAFQDKQSAALEAERQRLALMVESVDADRFSQKATDAESGGKNHSFTGGRVPLPADNSKQDFANKLEHIKAKYAALLDAQKQAEAEQTESVHAGTEHRMALRRGELLETQKLVEQYSSVKGAPKQLEATKAGINKQDTADQTEDFKTTRSIDENKFKTQEEQAQVHFRTMTELFKRSAQEGLMSYEDAAKAEIEAQKKLYAEKRDLAVKNFNESHPKGVDPNSEDAIKFQNSLDVASTQEQAQRSQDSRNVSQGSLKDSHAALQASQAKASLELTYADTLRDGAAKQKAVNKALADRLAADEKYLAAVQAANPNDRAIPELQAKVGQDKAAQLSEYNDTHTFQKHLDDSGQMQGNGFFDDLKQGSDKVAQAFALLDQTTQKLMASQGNLAQKVGAGAGGASGAIGQISGAFGGAMKDAGGMLSSIGSALPGIGAAVGVVGGVVSMIGNMFAAQAKHIAEDVQKKFDNIMQNYQNNTASFTETMAALQQEQSTAIAQLSGTKGGSGYLAQILLQVQQTEAALRAQVVQAQNNFEIQTSTIMQSTEVGKQWMQTWASIEQQVKDYLYKNGGNAALATEFQNAELADQARKIQDQYNQGLQQAVQDNYTLNGLMMSRQQIQLSILQLENQMTDSIERRQAPALGLAAQQTKLQLEQLKQQLSDTNNQINIEQQKVSAENSMFGLTTDINALHKEDAALQMSALNEQLANYKEMYRIIQSIHGLQADPNTGYFDGHSPFAGLPGGVPGFGTTSGPTAPSAHPIIISGDIHVNLPGMKSGSDVARGIGEELRNWSRYGVG